MSRTHWNPSPPHGEKALSEFLEKLDASGPARNNTLAGDRSKAVETKDDSNV
jgi:hypothetical protein